MLDIHPWVMRPFLVEITPFKQFSLRSGCVFVNTDEPLLSRSWRLSVLCFAIFSTPQFLRAPNINRECCSSKKQPGNKTAFTKCELIWGMIDYLIKTSIKAKKRSGFYSLNASKPKSVITDKAWSWILRICSFFEAHFWWFVHFRSF